MRDHLQQLIFRETTTLGIRVREENRVILARETTPVQTEFGVIHIKTGSWQGEEWNAAPEFEDCRRAAAAFDVPLKTVMQAAMAAWRTRQPSRAASTPGGGIPIMTTETILEMLQRVRDGGLRPEEAMERLANLPYEEAGFAKIDHHRRLRTGLPEVIYAGGKTAAQVAEIFFRMAAMGGDVLATRADEAAFAAVKALVPEAQYYPVARMVALRQTPPADNQAAGSLAVLCAGTSDLPVAEEAAVTAEVMGGRRAPDLRCGRRRPAPAARAPRGFARGRGGDCVRGDGRRAAQCRRGNGGSTRHRRTHQRGLRRGVWGHRGPAGHAEFMLAQCDGGQYR